MRQGDAEAKKAQLESARQNLQRLEQLQAFNRITAPFDGVVTARKIDVGALVTEGSTTGQELFHMSSTSRLRVYVQVPQAYASLIQPGHGGRAEHGRAAGAALSGQGREHRAGRSTPPRARC